MGEATALALARQNGDAAGALDVRNPAGFALTFEAMRERVEGLNQFYRGVMQEGTDYGKIPGTDKPTLLQPGAQLLDGIFGLAPTFEEMPSCVRDFEAGFFSFDIRCRLIEKRTGQVAAEGVGQCNSKEDRYRWRAAKRVCPSCGAETIIKGKKEYGGGWLCFAKKGGCGAKFGDNDQAIVGQAEGRVENDDTYSLVNTILKMAQKRAHVAATLNATGASRIFTQDVEDLPEFQRRSAEVVEGEFTETPRPAAAPASGGRPHIPQGSAAPVVDAAGVRGQQSPAEPSDPDDEFERLGEPRAQSYPWANTPEGRQILAMQPALDAAGAKYVMPPNDADEATLRGWISSKRTILQARRG